MEAILAVLIAALAIACAVPLAIVRSGIRRQEHAESLTSQPSGFAAALTRRLCGLHVTGRPAEHLTADDATTPQNENEAEVRSA